MLRTRITSLLILPSLCVAVSACEPEQTANPSEAAADYSAVSDAKAQQPGTVAESNQTSVPPQGGDVAFYDKRLLWGNKYTVLTMDFTKIDRPESVDSFKIAAGHLPPQSQGNTGTCWSFSGNSFVESELIRLNGTSPRMSEMYSVYWEYVEKTRRWLSLKGDTRFPEGSQSDGVVIRMKDHGMVPQEVYTGLKDGETVHGHRAMRNEIWKVLGELKDKKRFDEKKGIAKVRKILDKHLGAPPENVEVDGKKYTPQEYMTQVAKFPVEDYYSFVSRKRTPFYEQTEHKAEDNWWKGDHYYNLPLDEWYGVFKSAVQNGYSASICGDTSEPGDGTQEDIAVIPQYDIPLEYINQDSREYRIYNDATSDDHCIHVVGYQERNGHDWFLVKDSGLKALDGQIDGYYFYRGEFVKLKTLVFTVHKDAAKDIASKLKPRAAN